MWGDFAEIADSPFEPQAAPSLRRPLGRTHSLDRILANCLLERHAFEFVTAPATMIGNSVAHLVSYESLRSQLVER